MYLNYKKNLDKYRIIDIETDDLKATKIWCAVVMELNDKKLIRLIGHAEIKRYIESQPHDTIWVGHNALSFDIPTCNRLLGTSISVSRCVDTLVLSYLYHPGLAGGHGLEAWGVRLGIRKRQFSDFSHYSEEMHVYCEQDVRVTERIYSELVRRMVSIGYSEKSCQLEHEIRHVVNKQQRNGWYFDQVKARALSEKLSERCRQLERTVLELFPPTLEVQGTYEYRVKADGLPYASYTRHFDKYPELRWNDDHTQYETLDYETFNLGSPKQRLDKLLSLGFVPTKQTKTGGPSVDEDSLVEFAKANGRAEVQALADWLSVHGRLIMLDSWLGLVDPQDSCIHGSVFTCGANSRRMTHSGPNTANIPSNEARYGFECRSLWTVSDTSLFQVVGYDAKAVQMRMFAHFLPDPSLGQRYWDTELDRDPHATNAKLIGIERKPVKNVFYANLFGAYPPKLASTAGRIGSKAELTEFGTWIQGELYRVTPGLREATEAAKAEWRRNKGRLKCIDGGYVVCKSESAALNYKIQPAEACLMKTASVLIDKRVRQRGMEVIKIGDIHDEGQHRSRIGSEAIAFGELATQAIRDAGETLGFRVPMDGDYKIGNSWADTH